MNIERKHVLISIFFAAAFAAGIAASRFFMPWIGDAVGAQVPSTVTGDEKLKSEAEALFLTLSRDRSAVVDQLELFKTKLSADARREQNAIDDQIVLENSRWARISDLMNVGAEGFLAQEEHRETVRNLEVKRLDQEKRVVAGDNAGFLSVPDVPSCSLSVQSCYRLLMTYSEGLRDLRASYEELGSQILGNDPGFRNALTVYDRFYETVGRAAIKSYKLEADLCRSRSLTESICADLGSPPKLYQSQNGSQTTSVTAASGGPDNGLGASPSFNCRKAVNEDEKIICSNDDLARKDRQVADLYRKVRQVSSDRDVILQEQRQFLRSRSLCRSTECLTSAYDERLSRLESQM